MGFLKKLFEKGKKQQEPPLSENISPQDTSTERVEPPSPQAEQDPKEPTVISKIPIKNPLAIALEGIFHQANLPEKYSSISTELQALFAIGNLKTTDLQTIQGDIEATIAHDRGVIEKLTENEAAKGEITSGLKYLDDLSKRIEMVSPCATELTPTYENFLVLPCAEAFSSFKLLVSEIQEIFNDLDAPIQLKTSFDAFAYDLSETDRRYNAALAQVDTVKNSATSLAEEINKFSQTINKLKSMGQASMNQYLPQLSAVQEGLKEKREAFLQDEQTINAYLPAIYASLNQAFQVFNEYQGDISDLLKTRQSHLALDNREILLSVDNNLQIASLQGDLAALSTLQSNMEACIKIHKNFD